MFRNLCAAVDVGHCISEMDDDEITRMNTQVGRFAAFAINKAVTHASVGLTNIERGEIELEHAVRAAEIGRFINHAAGCGAWTNVGIALPGVQPFWLECKSEDGCANVEAADLQEYSSIGVHERN